MLCSHPYIRDRSVTRLETRMDKEKRLAATPFPCGQCLNCRINQARVWQHRIMLETMMHGDSMWVTLTYNDEHLPDPPCVDKKEIQKWLKRLRKLTPQFRYFIVGEYGEKTWRPHYHCCLFGLAPIYAQVVFDTWGKCDREGIQIGQINEKTARYTAGYTTQKLTKRQEFKANGLLPEFMLSSRKNGGIGYPAIVEIARSWRNSKWNDKRIIREIRSGKINVPLGRYLTKKLNELLGIPQEQFDAEYWIHQEQIFEAHKMGDPVSYYESIESEERTKAIGREKRHKMYKNRTI
jgi:hypothetical protein